MTANRHNKDLIKSAIQDVLPFSDYIIVYPALLETKQAVFSIGFMILSLFVLIFLIWGMYFIYNVENQEEIFIRDFKNTFGLIYDCLDKVLCIPIFGMCFTNIFKSSSFDSTTKLIIIIMSVIVLILVTIMEFLYVYLFFNFTFKIKDMLSRNSSGFTVVSLLFKIIIILLSVIMDQSNASNYQILLIIHIALGILMMSDAIGAFPYHQKNVSKTHGIFVAGYLWTNLTFFALYSFFNIELFSVNILILLLLGSAFFIKLFLNIRNYYSKVIINSELENISSDVLLDLKIRTYNSLFKSLHFSKKSELLLASLLKIHYDKCKELDTCPCRKRNFLYDPKKKDVGNNKINQFHKDNVFVKHFILKLCKDGQLKFKDSKLLTLDNMYYQFESLRVYPPILNSIAAFQKRYQNNMNFSIQFCLYRLAAKLNKFIENKNEKNHISQTLLIENVKIYDRGMKQIKDKIIKVSKLFNQMWEVLKDPLPNLNSINEICNENFQYIQDTNLLYKNLIAINNTSINLKILMDVYSQHILYDELLVQQVNKDIKLVSQIEVGQSIKQDIDFLMKKYNIYDNKTSVISLSSNQENMSQIIWASKNSDAVFGIPYNQLIGTSINEWMPTCYANVHDQILTNFYHTGREVKINNIMHTFGLDNNSLCFSMNLFVKIIPNLVNYEIMAMFHKLNTEDYFITEEDGVISAIGKNFKKLIDIDPVYLRKIRLNIQLFIPKILPVYQDYFESQNSKQEKQQLNKKDTVQKPFMGAQNGTEFKFYFVVPININKYIKNQIDLKHQFEKQFENDKNIDQKELKQRQVQYKEKYHEYIIKGINKHSYKRISKLIKFRAIILEDKFYNGQKNQFIKIFKIVSSEEKILDQSAIKKLKKQEVVLKKYCKQLKKAHDQAKTQSKQEEKEEEKETEEQSEKKDEETNKKDTKKEVKTKGGFGGFALKNLGRKSSIQRGSRMNIQFQGLQKQVSYKEREAKEAEEQVQLTEQEKKELREKNAMQTIVLLLKGQNTNPYITIGVKQKIEWVQKEKEKELKQKQEGVGKVDSKLAPLNGGSQLEQIVNNQQDSQNLPRPSRRQSRILSGFLRQKNQQGTLVRQANQQGTFLRQISNQDQEERLNHYNEMQEKQQQQKNQNNSRQSAFDNSNENNQVSQSNDNNDLDQQEDENESQRQERQRKTKKKKKIKADDELPVIPIFRKMRQKLLNKDNPLQISLGEKQYSYFKDYTQFAIDREENEQKQDAIFQFGMDDLDDQEEENKQEQKEEQGNVQNMGKSMQMSQKVENKEQNEEFDKAAADKLNLVISRWKIQNTKGVSDGNKNKGDGNSSSSSSNGDKDDNQALILEEGNSHHQNNESDQEEDKNFLDFLKQKDVQKEELAVAQSVNSSIQSSLNTQNVLRILRNSLQNQKTPLVLYLANLLVILMCLMVSILSITQYFMLSYSVDKFKEEMYAVDRITVYSENITALYEDYLDINLFQNKLYDQDQILNLYPNWWENQRAITKARMQNFLDFSLQDLSKAGSIANKQQDLRYYLFQQMDINMLISSKESKLQMNFQNFVRMYINAVNQTIDYDLDQFQTQNFQNNDYLYLISNNLFTSIAQNDKNFEDIQEQIRISVDGIIQNFFIIWLVTFSIIVICFAIIYPIILKSKLKMHESLTMFTFISMKDVEQYSEHYRSLNYILQNTDRFCDINPKIEKSMLQYQKLIMSPEKQMIMDQKSQSRSRQFKDIEINKWILFLQIFMFLIMFVIFSLIKDLQMAKFILQTQDLKDYHIQQHKLYYTSQKNIIQYKTIIKDFLEQNNLDSFDTNKNKLMSDIRTDVMDLLIQNYDFFGNNLDESYTKFMNTFITEDICDQQLQFSGANLEDCQQLSQGLLTKGYQNFILEFENLMATGLEVIQLSYEEQGYEAAKIVAYNEIRNLKLLDHQIMMEHIATITYDWYQVEEKTIFTQYDDQLSYNQIFLIILQFLILLFLVTVWRKVYLNQKLNSKWVNGFILMIPIQILRENQYLKSYLRSKLKINTMLN